MVCVFSIDFVLTGVVGRRAIPFWCRWLVLWVGRAVVAPPVRWTKGHWAAPPLLASCSQGARRGPSRPPPAPSWAANR